MTPTSFASAIIGLSFSSVALAQTSAPVSPGWSAYAGCWGPVPVEGQAAPVGDAKICVIPAGNAAELVSVVGNQITERTTINADGLRHDVARQGCSGWESAAFSADGRRLYMQSEQQCAGGLTRKTSGLFAIASNDQWINVVNVSAAGGDGLRVARYSPIATSSALPADVSAAFERNALADRTARLAAHAPVMPDVIIESNKFLAPPVVEAWIAELDQRFDLDEKTLIRLADGGVAPSVIDVMVAVSNPKAFAVRATGAGVAMTENQVTSRGMRNECLTPMLDPWGYYDYDPCDPYRRYGYYGSRRYSYGRGSYGYGSYDPFSYNGYGSGYGQTVVIIVRGSASDPERGHGKMTKDGYSRGTSSSTGTAVTPTRADRPARPSESARSSGSTSSGSTSSGSTSSGSTSSGSGGGDTRTATRKPPNI